MKKIIGLSMFVLSVFLTACTTTTDMVGEKPKFANAGNLTGVIDEDIDLMFNIVVLDEEDGDISNDVVITNLSDLPYVDGVMTSVGEFVIKYSVSDSDNNVTLYNRLMIITESENEMIVDSNCLDNREGYTLTFCDDFSNPVSPNAQGVDMTKWGYQNGDGSQFGIPGWGNNEQQWYREENSFVENGSLFIEAKSDGYNQYPYTSSKLVTNTKFAQTYGRFEARIKLPVGDGFWPAFWMLPEDSVYGGWAASGEIDIMEAKGRFPLSSSGAIHYGGSWPNNTYSHGSYSFDQGNGIDEFHVYAIEWTSESITWYVDDQVMNVETDWYTEGHDFPAPFNQDFFLILNLAVGGTFDGGITPPDSLFDTPQYMVVDYVRVYSID